MRLVIQPPPVCVSLSTHTAPHPLSSPPDSLSPQVEGTGGTALRDLPIEAFNREEREYALQALSQALSSTLSKASLAAVANPSPAAPWRTPTALRGPQLSPHAARHVVGGPMLEELWVNPTCFGIGLRAESREGLKVFSFMRHWCRVGTPTHTLHLREGPHPQRGAL
jgi:hypothetical protein